MRSAYQAGAVYADFVPCTTKHQHADDTHYSCKPQPAAQYSVPLAAVLQASTARMKASTKLVIEGLGKTGFSGKDRKLASSLSGCHLVDCCSK